MVLERMRTTSSALLAGAVPRRRPRGASSARSNRGCDVRLNPKRGTNFPVSSKRGAVKANLSGGKAQLVAKTSDSDRRSRASVRGVVAASECWEGMGNLRQGRRAHCYRARFAQTIVTRRAEGGVAAPWRQDLLQCVSTVRTSVRRGSICMGRYQAVGSSPTVPFKGNETCP